MSIPMIAGLYPYVRNGVKSPPVVTLKEIPKSLEINPSYGRDLIVLAGDRESAALLEGFGLKVRRVFNDAPAEIHRDCAQMMKHWMCRWALEEFGEFPWIDWDTVLLREPDEEFWSWCRSGGTPKFIHIPNYWATVNCGVYCASAVWHDKMTSSFNAVVSEPNDELLWASVLPKDVSEKPEFWWDERVVNIWTREDFAAVSSNTYFDM